MKASNDDRKWQQQHIGNKHAARQFPGKGLAHLFLLADLYLIVF